MSCHMIMAGDIRSETIKKNGFEPKKLSAVVLPDIEDTEEPSAI